jgi:FkbM family methyltransferase
MVLKILGNKFSYRLGRALYMQARGDIPNDMTINGELMIQKCVIKAIGNDKLVCFDVGANVGDWSANFLSLLSNNESKVFDLYAFEPVPSTAEILRLNLGSQNSNLYYEQIALSSENGIGMMPDKGLRCSGISSLNPESWEDNEKQVSVIKSTMVDFCLAKGINKIQLVKCDTEGHDMEVIRGALPLLADGKIDVFQFEYNFRWIFARNFLRDVFILTTTYKLPYKITKLQTDCLLILNEWHPELERYFEGNYALIHQDALNWFPTRAAVFDVSNVMKVKIQ